MFSLFFYFASVTAVGVKNEHKCRLRRKCLSILGPLALYHLNKFSPTLLSFKIGKMHSAIVTWPLLLFKIGKNSAIVNLPSLLFAARVKLRHWHLTALVILIYEKNLAFAYYNLLCFNFVRAKTISFKNIVFYLRKTALSVMTS